MSIAEYPNQPSQLMVVALLRDFRSRLAQENPDPAQLALVKGHALNIAAKLSASSEQVGDSAAPPQCPRKGNPKARDPKFRVDCTNPVIQPKRGGPHKECCGRKCSKAMYRGKNAKYLAKLKKDWWENLPDAEKAKAKKRQAKWAKDHRSELTAKHKQRRDRLPPEEIKKLNQRCRAWHKKQKQAVADGKRNWRPENWWKKPLEWRIIGDHLLSADYMGNADLFSWLDNSQTLKCPYAETWMDSLDKKKCSEDKMKLCSEFIRKIRVWVKKPGKTRGKEGVA